MTSTNHQTQSWYLTFVECRSSIANSSSNPARKTKFRSILPYQRSPDQSTTPHVAASAFVCFSIDLFLPLVSFWTEAGIWKDFFHELKPRIAVSGNSLSFYGISSFSCPSGRLDGSYLARSQLVAVYAFYNRAHRGVIFTFWFPSSSLPFQFTLIRSCLFPRVDYNKKVVFASKSIDSMISNLIGCDCEATNHIDNSWSIVSLVFCGLNVIGRQYAAGFSSTQLSLSQQWPWNIISWTLLQRM